MGISVKKEFRGEGIGDILLKTIIEEAKKRISGLRLISLSVFAIIIDKGLIFTKKWFSDSWENTRNNIL